jgi:hypothetical protein
MLVFIAAFFVIGLAGWMLMRRRKKKAVDATLERLNDWADASCPVCLALGAAEHLRHTRSSAIIPQNR